MFHIRRIVRVSVFKAHQQRKFLSTDANEVQSDEKPYPLQGIRVLDLTRIGNNNNHFQFVT